MRRSLLILCVLFLASCGAACRPQAVWLVPADSVERDGPAADVTVCSSEPELCELPMID